MDCRETRVEIMKTASQSITLIKGGMIVVETNVAAVTMECDQIWGPFVGRTDGHTECGDESEIKNSIKIFRVRTR